MPIPLTCACGRKLQVGEEHAGQEGTCPACGRTLRIPAIDSALGTAAPPGSPITSEAPEPERELTDHGGGALPEEADFFVPPPERIGPVLSAHTTMTRRDRPFPPALRIFLAVAGGLAGLLVGGIGLNFRIVGGRWEAFWPIALMALGIAVAAYFTGFSHTCTYVGRDGVARFTCSGGRELVGKAEVFCFEEAAELRTARYRNGYTYEWRDGAGRLRYRIRDTHRPSADDPPSADPFHYAWAAERAWTLYLLEQVPQQLEQSGFVGFSLGGGRSVRLARGPITFRLGGPPVELAARQVERVEVREGQVWVLQAGEEDAVISFPLAALANAELFFHLLRELVGVEVR